MKPPLTNEHASERARKGEAPAEPGFAERPRLGGSLALPEPIIHPATNGDAAAQAVGSLSVASLLTRHLLSDGELILLVLKPSRWFIVIQSVRFAAIVSILVIGAIMYLDRSLTHAKVLYAALGSFMIIARVMWAVLQWMGRLYILTDMRIVRLSGVFNMNIFDCSLRKIARTHIIRTTRERLLALGSIEIIPLDEQQPIGLWQTIARPKKVHEQILEAITKAKTRGQM